MAINQEEMLNVLLAHSATWQSLLGVTSASEALERLRRYQADKDGDNPVSYPHAVVEHVEQEKTLAGTATWRGRGALLISLYCEPPDEVLESVESQRTWFVALANDIEADLRTVSASRATPDGYSTSHLQIKTITWAVEPFLVPEPEREEQDTTEDVPQKPLWAMQWRVEY